MIVVLLLSFCLVSHLSADPWQYPDEIANRWRLPERPEFHPVNLPMAIFSKVVVGTAGGCYGKYVALSYDFSEQEAVMAGVVSCVTSLITLELLLQNRKFARTVNTIYRACQRKCDQWADDFIGRP